MTKKAHTLIPLTHSVSCSSPPIDISRNLYSYNLLSLSLSGMKEWEQINGVGMKQRAIYYTVLSLSLFLFLRLFLLFVLLFPIHWFFYSFFLILLKSLLFLFLFSTLRFFLSFSTNCYFSFKASFSFSLLPRFLFFFLPFYLYSSLSSFVLCAFLLIFNFPSFSFPFFGLFLSRTHSLYI